MHLVEEGVQCLFVVALDGESHAGLGLGAIVVHHPLGNMHSALVEQPAHDALHILETGGAGEFGDLHFAALVGEVEDYFLAVAERAGSFLFKVGVRADKRLALNLQPAGNSRLVDLAHGAQVVVGNPLPELELGVAKHWALVKQSEDFFHLIALWLNVVGHHHDGSVVLLATKWHKHTITHPHTQRRGDAVGVSALNRQGQNYFGKLWHRCKDTIFFASWQKKFYSSLGSSGGRSGGSSS